MLIFRTDFGEQIAASLLPGREDYRQIQNYMTRLQQRRRQMDDLLIYVSPRSVHSADRGALHDKIGQLKQQ